MNETRVHGGRGGRAPPGARRQLQANPVPPYVRRVATFLREDDRGDAAASLLATLQTPARSTPRVHVAGEAKRGKSCLVNALLRTPDLSPVGVEATTAAPITFHHADEPTAVVFRYGSDKGEEVDVDRARTLATVAGNPGNRENVRAVSIGLQFPLLRQLDLIDTPGVGGLGSGHGALTLQSLTTADALIFVLEAGAQFHDSELRFLREAAARIDTVVFTLAKVDLYRGWRTVRDDNVAILREQAPRFAHCPMVPVSSTLALRALALEDEDEAEALRDESGLTKLDEVLRAQILQRSSALQRRNLLRASIGLLDAAQRQNRQKLAAVETANGRRALQAEQTRLRQLTQERARWTQVLDTEIRKLTLERQEGVTRGTVEIRRRYDQRLKTITRKEFDSLPGELIADLTALASELNEAAAERLVDLVTNVLAGIDETSELEAEIGHLTGQSLADELTGTQLGSHGMSHLDKLIVFNTFAAGRALASILSGSGAGIIGSTILVPPVGLALGFALGGFFAFETFRGRSRQIFATEFTAWMRDQITQAQLSMNTSFNRGIFELQSQIKTGIRTALADREREINQALAEARAHAEAEASRRGELRRRLEGRQVAGRRLRGEGQSLLQAARRVGTRDEGSRLR